MKVESVSSHFDRRRFARSNESRQNRTERSSNFVDRRERLINFEKIRNEIQRRLKNEKPEETNERFRRTIGFLLTDADRFDRRVRSARTR